MPISTDRFDELDDDGPESGPNAHEILTYLEGHADEAFTQSEIAKETGVASDSVGPALVRLRESGRVDLKGTYWRVSDHVRGLDSSAKHAEVVAVSHEAGSFDYDEWQEHAVDPRENRE
ncbi:hypothetical protein SAMN05216559_2059 [Halomicrobium zhouii]|uniref:MarR family transcriptional regulator n=1 Tax=Halomicrobium zhouii TaxID=767519 RepID=A0A1I6L5N6_9EURY|nr:MarR family transcriptional regulator [Halomicrobium zhouii]SFR98580.1 hypothetical protein SAMN05216559_2059 [Halomicrobium zhouii]